MMSISYSRIVWHNAYRHEVLGAGFPFPRSRLLSMDASALEHSVRRAHRIGQFWRSSTAHPRKITDFTTSVAAEVTSVRFLPGSQGTRVVTVTKGIWPKITCWEVPAHVTPPQARKIAEWSPKGMIFTGFVVNSDADSQGMIAASLIDEGFVVNEHPCLILTLIRYLIVVNVSRCFRYMNMRAKSLLYNLSEPSIRPSLRLSNL